MCFLWLRLYHEHSDEYGNEQIKAPQTVCRDRQAAEGAALYQQLRALYPNGSKLGRPRLIGPDAGGPISSGYLRNLADRCVNRRLSLASCESNYGLD